MDAARDETAPQSPAPAPPRAKPPPSFHIGRAVVGVFAWLFAFVVAAGILVGGGLAAMLWNMSHGLPEYSQLEKYQPAVMTRVHAGDGRVFAEFATERRLYVPIEAMPPLVIDAFLSAEDKSFWSHPGISLPDIARAAMTNVVNWGSKRPIGASTITQQVAKNFLLTNEISIERKVKEAVLALRIEEVLPKPKILELYLNEIFLGLQSYGVAAASLRYFGKSLEELTLPEAAYLAALPKAPNNYNPFRKPENAKARRDWVLGRMLDDGKIKPAEYEAAKATPLQVRERAEIAETQPRADYFAEEVRRELLARYGDEQVYRGGLSVRTSLDPRVQQAMDESLRRGMMVYDRRHGWRGAQASISAGGDWRQALAPHARVPGAPSWQGAVVLALAGDRAEIGLANGTRAVVPFEEMRWARRTLEDQRLGPPPRNPADVVAIGDVIVVEPLADAPTSRRYALRQVPNVGAAAVALDPHTGRVIAMSGGWSFEQSQFNRATQAQRQPGSAFKPFVYLAALQNGFTPSSIILDAPVTVEQGDGQGLWRPSNYSRQFYGPTPLRVGVELSRNLMTVRLAQSIGLTPVVTLARDFGISERMPAVLSSALGSVETTVLRLTAAYGVIVNGGLRVTPTLIDRVQDRNGRTIYRADGRDCAECVVDSWKNQAMPSLPDIRERVADPGSAFQMISILQGVVERGTGTRARGLGRPIGGKTGTTNDVNDVWFVGFSSDLVVGVWFGFDNPRTLGEGETGGSVAVPVFRDIMAEALKNTPVAPFRVPSSVRLVRVDPKTGLPSNAGIWEAFKPGTEPSGDRPAGTTTERGFITAPSGSVPATSQSGIY